MARRPRHIQIGQLYEMVFRAKEGIPLPCTEYMNFLITGQLAKAMKEEGISLCHYAFIGTHAHILFVPHCKSRLRNFGAQLKSGLTRVLKRVLGYETHQSLHLWDGRSTIMQILDIEMAIERIVYIYCNPAKANLVKSINEYPGVSSWEAFRTAEAAVDAQVEIRCPFVPEKEIEPLLEEEPERYQELLKQKVKEVVCFVIEPNVWMNAFGITCEKELSAISEKIVNRINVVQDQLELKRRQKGHRLMSRRRLTKQSPTISGRVPRKKERKIYFLSSCKQLRMDFVEYFRRFCYICRELYQNWKKSVHPKEKWPPQAYLPQQP